MQEPNLGGGCSGDARARFLTYKAPTDVRFHAVGSPGSARE
jgi:hypothetical protein